MKITMSKNILKKLKAAGKDLVFLSEEYDAKEEEKIFERILVLHAELRKEQYEEEENEDEEEYEEEEEEYEEEEEEEDEN